MLRQHQWLQLQQWLSLLLLSAVMHGVRRPTVARGFARSCACNVVSAAGLTTSAAPAHAHSGCCHLRDRCAVACVPCAPPPLGLLLLRVLLGAVGAPPRPRSLGRQARCRAWPAGECGPVDARPPRPRPAVATRLRAATHHEACAHAPRGSVRRAGVVGGWASAHSRALRAHAVAFAAGAPTSLQRSACRTLRECDDKCGAHLLGQRLSSHYAL
jgi:hypothetical protein